MKKTKIISAFPGTGKTWLYENQDKIHLSILDSDSSKFSWSSPGIRHADFPNNYIDHIKENIGKYDIILVSSHEVVRNALKENNINYTLVHPTMTCRETYLQRYKDRGDDQRFIDFIYSSWVRFIAEMSKEKFPTVVQLNPGSYLLNIPHLTTPSEEVSDYKRMSENVSNKIKYIFIVDAECDGLYGEIFSIGALVADIRTMEPVLKFNLTSTYGMERVKQDFVKEHVIPAIKADNTMVFVEKPITKLLDYFWIFYEAVRESSIVIADFGAPVEARLFSQCITDDADREFKGPYPLHELGTILLLNNIDPDFCRDSYYDDITLKHSPYFDCLATLKILKTIYPDGM